MYRMKKKFDKIVRPPKPVKGQLSQQQYENVVQFYKELDEDTLCHIVDLYNKDHYYLRTIEQKIDNTVIAQSYFNGEHENVEYEEQLVTDPDLQKLAENYVRKQVVAEQMTPFAQTEEIKFNNKLAHMLRNIKH